MYYTSYCTVILPSDSEGSFLGGIFRIHFREGLLNDPKMENKVAVLTVG
jgi:hypothetical protein